MASKPAISPHVKGIDICGTKDSVCIIRSDLGCYMKCGGKLDSNQQLPIYPLNPSCAGGDHYLCKDSTFYIIRGNSFICVNDLTEPTGLDITVKPLAENCENGDHYLSFGGNFCIIFTQKNEYLIVSDLTTGKVVESATIIKANQNGLYYYGSPSKAKIPAITIVQQVSEWGAMYTLTSSLKELGENYFVYPDVINFLPGGLSTTFGPTEAKWELLQSITNECKTVPLQWSEKITKTVGYNKSHFQSIEHNWNTTASVSMGTKYQSGFIIQASIETQFSLSTSYGGVNIRSEQEDWNEAFTTEESLSTTIKQGATVYIWQFRLGLKGTVDVLFCRDLQITDTSDPPTNIPLPQGSNQ